MTLPCGDSPERSTIRVWSVIAALVLAACGGGGSDVPAPLPPTATFVPLGFLSGYTTSQATAVSPDGSMVAGTAGTAPDARQAFRWTARQGPTGLGFLAGGTYSTAAAIAADGTVLGSGDTAAPPATSMAVFRWSADSGAARLESPPGATLCSASGMSGDATAVVGTCLAAGNEAYRWIGSAAPVGLGRFGGGSNRTSSAAAVSKDGSTIVGTGHPVLTGAVIWNRDGVATVLGKLAGDGSAYGVAATREGGTVFGTAIDGNQVARGFRWRQAAAMESLGAAPAGVTGTHVAGVAGDGSRIVGWGPSGGSEVALVWDESRGWRTLAAMLSADYRTEVAGRQLVRATAISDSGRAIVGYGTNPAGQTEAWLVLLPD